MKSLIIGAGEVGNGLHQVIGGDIMDKAVEKDEHYDIIHICFPYSDKFIDYVKEYQAKFKPKYTVVHSTVPVGTCEKLEVVHSPIRGVHPHLADGIRTFVKYFGGKDAKEVAEHYKDCFQTKVVERSRDTEALKLWDTTQYGAMILLNKEIYNWCEENDIDFELIYKDGNKTYNEGYKKLGRDEVVRPYLNFMEGKIGGHCVSFNIDLFESKTCQDIKNYQKNYEI